MDLQKMKSQELCVLWCVFRTPNPVSFSSTPFTSTKGIRKDGPWHKLLTEVFVRVGLSTWTHEQSAFNSTLSSVPLSTLSVGTIDTVLKVKCMLRFCLDACWIKAYSFNCNCCAFSFLKAWNTGCLAYLLLVSSLVHHITSVSLGHIKRSSET